MQPDQNSLDILLSGAEFWVEILVCPIRKYKHKPRGIQWSISLFNLFCTLSLQIYYGLLSQQPGTFGEHLLSADLLLWTKACRFCRDCICFSFSRSHTRQDFSRFIPSLGCTQAFMLHFDTSARTEATLLCSGKFSIQLGGLQKWDQT